MQDIQRQSEHLTYKQWLHFIPFNRKNGVTGERLKQYIASAARCSESEVPLLCRLVDQFASYEYERPEGSGDISISDPTDLSEPELKPVYNPNAENKILGEIDLLEMDLNERCAINEITGEIVDKKSGNVTTPEDLWREINAGKKSKDVVPLSQIVSLVKANYVVSRFSPIRDFHGSLPPWDSGNRILEYCESLPTADKDLAVKYITLFLIKMLRQMTLNETNRFMLVYQGTEHTGKSRAIEWLNPLDNRYAKVGPIVAEDKDSRIALNQFVLWSDDELHVMSQQDLAKLKALLSQRFVTERRPYGRLQEYLPRICSFGGSINPSQFLSSAEGNTRFLVIGMIDGQPFDWQRYERIDKRQFWAQVKYLDQTGWLSANQSRVMELQRDLNKEFTVRTRAEELIEEKLMQSAGRKPLVMSLHEIMACLDPFGELKLNESQVRALLLAKFKFGRGYPSLEAGIETRQRGFFCTKKVVPLPAKVVSAGQANTPPDQMNGITATIGGSRIIRRETI